MRRISDRGFSLGCANRRVEGDVKGEGSWCGAGGGFNSGSYLPTPLRPTYLLTPPTPPTLNYTLNFGNFYRRKKSPAAPWS